MDPMDPLDPLDHLTLAFADSDIPIEMGVDGETGIGELTAFMADMRLRFRFRQDGGKISSIQALDEKNRLFELERRVLALEAAPCVYVKLEPGARLYKATCGSSGYDLGVYWPENDDMALVLPGCCDRFRTGVSIAMPPGYEAQVRPRSGLSTARINVAFGTVDRDYRGEISVVVTNNSNEGFEVRRGHRIAQLVFARVVHPRLEQVDELGETKRGSGGFGSTGS